MPTFSVGRDVCFPYLDYSFYFKVYSEGEIYKITKQDDDSLVEELALNTIFIYNLDERTPVQIPIGPVICPKEDCSEIIDLFYVLYAYDSSG
jgi:hypothetical protein